MASVSGWLRGAALLFLGALGIWSRAPLARHSPAALAAGPRVMWRIGGEGRGRPAVDASTVYFLSKRHEVMAVDAKTGQVQWRAGTGEPGSATQGPGVVLAGSAVIAGDNNLIAFDRVTGTARWRFAPAAADAPGLYLGQPSGDLVLAGSSSGRVYAVSAARGDLMWSAVIAGDGRTTVFPPATDGKVVAVGYTTFVVPNRGGVVLLDLLTGQELWRTDLPRPYDHLVNGLSSGSAGGPVITDTMVVVSSGDGSVFGMDLKTGFPRWMLPPIRDVPPVLQGPIPVPESPAGADYRPLAHRGRMLIVGSLKGHVIAYDWLTQQERWRFHEDRTGSVAFGLSVDDESVYVPYVSGKHVVLSLLSGQVRWRTEDAGEGFIWPGVSDRSRVYLAGSRGGFVAFER